MWLADTSIKRPVTATMFLLALVVLGIVSYPTIGVDLYPKVDLPIVNVTTRLTGAVTAIEHPTTVPKHTTRRSLRAGRQARVAQPAGSWFDPHPAGSSRGQGRGLGL